MESVDCIVIGAGVVGLAVARALSMAGREVIVVERADAIGTGISSRNSEVIHAGIYYPPGSAKAKLCVAGKDMLYAYCRRHMIPHRRTGKLIVASTDTERDALASILNNGLANGVTDLQWLERESVLELEPDLVATAAIFSPSTGIIDTHGFMQQLQADAEIAGATFAFNTAVASGALTDDGVELVLEPDAFRLRARAVVNCAGLHAHEVSRSIDGVAPQSIPSVSYAKGSYFALNRRSGFTHLIYPVPEPGGLGVHLTLDLGGGVRFGPDVEVVETIDYEVDPQRARDFYAAIRRYWPDLRNDDLRADFSGIRPKTNGLHFADFQFSDPHGGRIVSLYGIESPGLTSSLAIADHVLAMVG